MTSQLGGLDLEEVGEEYLLVDLPSWRGSAPRSNGSRGRESLPSPSNPIRKARIGFKRLKSDPRSFDRI